MTQTDGLLFDPNTYDPQQFDDETRRLLRATIDWFEGQGKKRILDDDLAAQWPADFVEFVKREKLFATFLTPSEFADGDPEQALGRRPQRRALRDPRVLRADLLVHRAGHHPGARAHLAEREQGRQAQGGRRPRGRGGDGVRAVRARARRRRLQHRHGAHARRARRTAPTASCTGRRGRSTTSATATSRAWFRCSAGAATSTGSDAYVFFAADSRHENYHLIDNVVHMQIYVSTFRLENYPVREEDILHTGVEAFAAALNTVNVGKFNLCTCSIGMTEHAFYEAITHAQNRILYGNPVTDFAHVRANFVDAYARIDRDEAVQPALGRLLPQREPRRPALPAVQPHDQGQGHDGGRDRAAVRCTM